MFDAQGRFRLELCDDVLVLSASGTWNRQLTEQFTQALFSLENQLPRQWAHLVFLEDWQIISAEAEKLILPAVNWVEQHGLTHTAHIYSFSPLKRHQLERVIPTAQRRHHKQDFNRLAPACAWLSQQGYHSAIALPQHLCRIPDFAHYLN